MELRIEGDLTIHDIARHHAGLLEPLSDFSGEALRLDLRGVGEVDTAGVQVLLALRKFLIARNARLIVEDISPELRQVLQTYQLDAEGLAPLGDVEALERPDE